MQAFVNLGVDGDARKTADRTLEVAFENISGAENVSKFVVGDGFKYGVLVKLSDEYQLAHNDTAASHEVMNIAIAKDASAKLKPVAVCLGPDKKGHHLDVLAADVDPSIDDLAEHFTEAVFNTDPSVFEKCLHSAKIAAETCSRYVSTFKHSIAAEFTELDAIISQANVTRTESIVVGLMA